MGEFWLGNINLNNIVSQGSYSLRVDMSDFEGNSAYAYYSSFNVGDGSTNYRLTVGGYSGTAGDGLAKQNNMAFSTYDRDLDGKIDENCAVKFKGAWWYQSCHNSNLNGQYLGGEHTALGEGVNWKRWKGYYYSLKSSSMKILYDCHANTLSGAIVNVLVVYVCHVNTLPGAVVSVLVIYDCHVNIFPGAVVCVLVIHDCHVNTLPGAVVSVLVLYDCRVNTHPEAIVSVLVLTTIAMSIHIPER
ncbi:hypothetical protein ScPMuIL_010385 [Solemya velum]